MIDELDVKILRALISESAVAPSNEQVGSSLRAIAGRLGADDMTVNYRYKRLQGSGLMSGWRLLVNPIFFGCQLLDVMVDVQPESAKSDMVRKLKLVHEIIGIIKFYGRALKMIVMYNGDESRLRTIELISRITNTEKMTKFRWAVPQCRTERLSETDVAIIRALSNDARKSFVKVSGELGLSARTVRNRVNRLRMENTVFTLPILNMGGVPGFIPFYISYSYSKSEAKNAVDRAMLSHFETSYLWGGLSDPESGYVLLSTSTVSDVQKCLEWGESLPGITSARVDILTETLMFPEKQSELLARKNERGAIQKKAYF
ncbi:MAG: AsnC family transcriptional regulator [Nitrososphaerales archaeon]